MACATLYQCMNFLARRDGVISLTTNPDDPCKNRCAVKVIGDDGKPVIATIEYDCVTERDMQTVLTKVCNALREQVDE